MAKYKKSTDYKKRKRKTKNTPRQLTNNLFPKVTRPGRTILEQGAMDSAMDHLKAKPKKKTVSLSESVDLVLE